MNISDFIQSWVESENQIKKGFLELKELIQSMSEVNSEFVAREGLTYSFRAKHEQQNDKPLFVMVDVIEGEPRWLSVCFYADLISDTEEKGDFVPGGLLGEDAVCFDLEEYDEEMVAYLKARIKEGAAKAVDH